ncbi:MAG: hypothetical protein P2A85_09110 [Microcoleus anatoxicus]|uniref:hypothetical protein n=1 Tax=Microcoleus anatoxicus TaxID=2705319 RepID=UPI00366DAB55
MKSQPKAQPACDIAVYADKGSLALRFPKRHNPLWEALDGKSLKGKPKCLGIGKYGFSADEPDDWKRAAKIAALIESDLDHPEWEKLFDPTLAKYGLGGGKYAKLAEVLQLPGTVQPEPEITVGEMWEAYLEWKKDWIEPTTFELNYKIVFSNTIKGLVWNNSLRVHSTFSGGTIWDMSIDKIDLKPFWDSPICTTTKQKALRALSEAFCRMQSIGETSLMVNPFSSIDTAKRTVDKYQSTVNTKGEIQEWWQSDNSDDSNPEESDRRAYSSIERDIIIQSFYSSDKNASVVIAPLIEFLFLTGCRSGEAFAIRWQDIFIGRDKNYIRFSKSYNGRLKNTQVTKTGEVRLFKIYPRLNSLLMRIKPVDTKGTDLVFVNTQGASYNSGSLDANWREYGGRKNGKMYRYPGVVTQLVEQGAIGCYLSPYHTRHTFITLQAQSGTDLLLLATACGNSVEVIQRHYLGIDTDVNLADI